MNRGHRANCWFILSLAEGSVKPISLLMGSTHTDTRTHTRAHRNRYTYTHYDRTHTHTSLPPQKTTSLCEEIKLQISNEMVFLVIAGNKLSNKELIKIKTACEIFQNDWHGCVAIAVCNAISARAWLDLISSNQYIPQKHPIRIN